MPAPALDLRRSLYDACGCRHTLVHATPRQVVTRLEGAYWLWDRGSGRCLMHGLADERLSNERPADADLRAHGDSVAETRAWRLARETLGRVTGRPGAQAPAVPRPEPTAAIAAGWARPPAALAPGAARRSAAPRAAALPLSSLALFAAAAFACLLPVPARR